MDSNSAFLRHQGSDVQDQVPVDRLTKSDLAFPNVLASFRAILPLSFYILGILYKFLIEKDSAANFFTLLDYSILKVCFSHM